MSIRKREVLQVLKFFSNLLLQKGYYFIMTYIF